MCVCICVWCVCVCVRALVCVRACVVCVCVCVCFLFPSKPPHIVGGGYDSNGNVRFCMRPEQLIHGAAFRTPFRGTVCPPPLQTSPPQTKHILRRFRVFPLLQQWSPEITVDRQQHDYLTPNKWPKFQWSLEIMFDLLPFAKFQLSLEITVRDLAASRPCSHPSMPLCLLPVPLFSFIPPASSLLPFFVPFAWHQTSSPWKKTPRSQASEHQSGKWVDAGINATRSNTTIKTKYLQRLNQVSIVATDAHTWKSCARTEIPWQQKFDNKMYIPIFVMHMWMHLNILHTYSQVYMYTCTRRCLIRRVVLCRYKS